MSVARAAVTLFGGRSASVVVGFVAVTVFARELGAAVLGSYFLFQAALGVLGVLTDAGVRGAVVKRISEGRPADRVFATALGLQAVFLAPVLILVVVFLGPIEAFLGRELGGVLVAATVLHVAAKLSTAVLHGEIRVERAASIEFLGRVTYASVGIVLVLGGAGIYGPVGGLIVSYVVEIVGSLLSMDTRAGRPSFDMAGSLLAYARHNVVTRVGGVGYSWIDVVVIGVFLTPAHVGAYELAWKVAAVVLVFTDAISSAAFPQLSEYTDTDRIDRIEATLTRLLTPSMAVVIPALFGTVVLSREILGIVFGPEYVLASLPLVVLMANTLSSGFTRPVTRTLNALDRPDRTARSVLLTLVLNVAFNLALVPHYGIVGAAVATSVASFIGNLLALAYLDRLLDVRFQWPVLAWSLACAVVMSVVVAAVRQAVVVDTLVALFALVGLGVGTYGCLLLASPTARSLVRDALSATLGRWPSTE